MGSVSHFLHSPDLPDLPAELLYHSLRPGGIDSGFSHRGISRAFPSGHPRKPDVDAESDQGSCHPVRALELAVRSSDVRRIAISFYSRASEKTVDISRSLGAERRSSSSYPIERNGIVDLCAVFPGRSYSLSIVAPAKIPAPIFSLACGDTGSDRDACHSSGEVCRVVRLSGARVGNPSIPRVSKPSNSLD